MTSLSRGLAGALLVVAAGLFAIGAANESNSESTTVAPVESAGTHVEASETNAEGAVAEGAVAHAEPSEKVLGIRPDSAPLVVAALIASLGLAAGLWFSRWRWVCVVAGLGALLFAVFDIAELIHQLDVSRAGRAVLAGVVAVAHLGAAVAAANAVRRSQPGAALTF